MELALAARHLSHLLLLILCLLLILPNRLCIMSASDQIRQMVNFILQEAHEKANEIRVKVRRHVASRRADLARPCLPPSISVAHVCILVLNSPTE